MLNLPPFKLNLSPPLTFLSKTRIVESSVNKGELKMKVTFTFEDRKLFDERHGGPFDRGSADSYYQRPIEPHYYKGATHNSDYVSKEDMTKAELMDYLMGYEWNEQCGDKKEY